MYSWTDTTASQQLATTLMNAKDNFISQAVDPVIALLPVCMYIANHTTIDLSHWKVAVRYYLQLGVYLQACQPSYPKRLGCLVGVDPIESLASHTNCKKMDDSKSENA